MTTNPKEPKPRLWMSNSSGEDRISFDLCMSATGRLAFVQNDSIVHASQKFVLLDLKKNTSKRLHLTGSNRKREHFFLFSVGADKLVLISRCWLPKMRSVLGLFWAQAQKVGQKSILQIGKLVAQPMLIDIDENYGHTMVFQYKNELVVLICYGDRHELARYNLLHKSVQKRTLSVESGLRLGDGVAHDGKLYLFELCPGIEEDNLEGNLGHLTNPKQVYIVDFENEYEIKVLQTEPDEHFGFPPVENGDHSIDHVASKMCVLYSFGPARAVEMWILDLITLRWRKIEFEFACCQTSRTLMHCTPSGQGTVLAKCNAKSGFHVYQFWVDVPRLEALALVCLEKYLKNGCKKEQLEQIGLQKKYVNLLCE